MIQNEKEGIKAFQRLLVQGRWMANEQVNNNFAKFFDDFECLPSLMLVQEDCSLRFGNYLKEICSEFNCDFINQLYTNNV